VVAQATAIWQNLEKSVTRTTTGRLPRTTCGAFFGGPEPNWGVAIFAHYGLANIFTPMPVPTAAYPVPVTMVANEPQLGAMLPLLSAATSWAFDLEFDRDRYTYGFNLCLLQIATPQQVFIVDPLAIADLQSLFRLFETAAATKLCYSSGEDLRLLHSLHCFPTQLVDLELYARLLNFEKTSLAAMLHTQLQVELNKSLQKVNWGRRPLTEAQLEYAAADVRYLFALHQALQQQVQGSPLAAWVQAEMALLNAQRHDMSAKTWFLKAGDERLLSPHQQYVLNQGFVWRDALAQKLNKPSHQVMPEEALRRLILDDLEQADLLDETGLHPQLRKPSTLEALYTALDRWHQQAHAQGLSKKRSPYDQGAAPELRQQRTKDKASVWQPIQQHLAFHYGEHTMRFLLSSTQIDALLSGRTTIGSLLPAYRQQCIADAALALGVDVLPWA
jgi:ribonuclease D